MSTSAKLFELMERKNPQEKKTKKNEGNSEIVNHGVSDRRTWRESVTHRVLKPVEH